MHAHLRGRSACTHHFSNTPREVVFKQRLVLQARTTTTWLKTMDYNMGGWEPRFPVRGAALVEPTVAGGARGQAMVWLLVGCARCLAVVSSLVHLLCWPCVSMASTRDALDSKLPPGIRRIPPATTPPLVIWLLPPRSAQPMLPSARGTVARSRPPATLVPMHVALRTASNTRLRKVSRQTPAGRGQDVRLDHAKALHVPDG